MHGLLIFKFLGNLRKSAEGLNRPNFTCEDPNASIIVDSMLDEGIRNSKMFL
jgi:hypothetical protein